jgi:hypothetical protein
MLRNRRSAELLINSVMAPAMASPIKTITITNSSKVKPRDSRGFLDWLSEAFIEGKALNHS